MVEVEQNSLKNLKSSIDKLEKEYGVGTIMKLEDNNVNKIDSISTGSL